MQNRRAATILLLCLPAATAAADPLWLARGRQGMVASDAPEASQIGAAILSSGGNAFDAAIATSLALGVARPQSTGLGGGGFMLAYRAEQKALVALDFRETAPACATPEYFAQAQPAEAGPSPSVYGGKAVAVPGLLAGLHEIHRRYGSKSWSELVAPAVELAERGFTVDQAYRDACADALRDFQKWPQLATRFAAVHSTLLNGGEPPELGRRIPRPDLAEALRLIARDGPAALYDGPIGAAIVKAIRSADGSLSREDLRAYRVRERRPLRATFGPYAIVSMPPPSSGGACVIESLNVLDCLASGRGGIRQVWQAGELPPLLARSFQHAFADRSRWFGDPDCVEVPVAQLIDREYACRLAARPVSGLDDFGSTTLPDDGGTSHFCVADRLGNVVAITETINGTFGSLVVADPYGIVLNNEMDDFSIYPDRPNIYGLVQGRANAVAPGKRPLSSMSPTIVLKDDRPVLTVGASGGPRIITAVAQVLLAVLALDQPVEQAVSAVRMHQQWRPEEVYFDQAPPEDLAETLRRAGLKVSEERKTAVVNAIQLLPDGTMIGVSDPRRGGRPVALP